MFDDRGAQLEEAPPSTPVEILGMEGLPQAGDQFVVVADRDKARGISDYREQKAREATLAKSSRVSLEGLAEQLKTEGTKELAIILKGDVQGSVEVLADLLTKLSGDKVKIKVSSSTSVSVIPPTPLLKTLIFSLLPDNLLSRSASTSTEPWTSPLRMMASSFVPSVFSCSASPSSDTRELFASCASRAFCSRYSAMSRAFSRS